MSEDRPANDPAVELGQLRRDYEDLKSTLLAQAGRRPVGDIEATIRSTPKANTVFAQGQTVNRADYPVLWQWVQDQALSGAGKPFGTGDGSTTFVLPDWRGRTPIGAGTGAGGTYAVGETGGAATINLTIAQLASHTHTINNENTGHNHGTSNSGTHVGHAWQAVEVGSASPGATAVLFSSYSSPAANGGNHNHGLTGGQDAFHTHPASNTGSGAAVDVRQPYVAVNWLLWT